MLGLGRVGKVLGKGELGRCWVKGELERYWVKGDLGRCWIKGSWEGGLFWWCEDDLLPALLCLVPN